jgi:hypothetical protein
MIKTIGWLMILVHDIHYGYEGGQHVNFTIESKESLTEDQVREILEKHFNEGKSVEQRKSEWLDVMPTRHDFNCELTFDEFNDYPNDEIKIKV